MKIEVSRSFSRTIQVAPYEPVNIFCAAKMEMDKDVRRETAELVMRDFSDFLDKFVQSEVEKSAAKFRKPDTKKNEDVGRDDAERDVGEN